jgi:hypothetical protein
MNRYEERMKEHEEGVSELLDETLILGLGIVLAAFVLMLVFGVLPTMQKTAYIIPLSGIKDVSGKTVITVFDRGGDPVYFNATPLASYKATIYVDTTAGSFAAAPVPGLNVLRPGDLVYLYFTGSGFVLTNTLNGASITTLPAGQVIVRMVDANSNVLISREVVVQGNVTVTRTSTATATATVTPTATAPANVTTIVTTVTATPSPTATANITATATATATPAPAATAKPETKTVTVKWSPSGLGYGSQSPPAQLTNGQEVKVPKGSSQTFYFVPNVNKAVLTIKLDGTTVYSGSAVGSTIPYTVTNIAEDRTLTATFG